MKVKARWILPLIGIALLAAVWFILKGPGTADQERAGSDKAAARSERSDGRGARIGRGMRGGPSGPVPVVAGVVEEKDVPIYLDGIGTVQAFNMVTVRAQVDGTIERIAFTEGQQAHKGDLLAVIDPRPYQAQLDQAVAKKAQDEAQLQNARITLKRNQDLLARKVLDQQTYDTQKYLVAQLEALVQADQAAIDNARTQLSYTQVTAPIDGRVGIRSVDEGNLVRASDASGIVTLTQLQPISVLFTLPQQDLPKVVSQTSPTGKKVMAVDRANAKELSEGTLAVVDNQIDSTTGTIRLKATFANADLHLWPGQFINTRLLVDTRQNGLVVPAPVIQRGPKGSYVYVIKEDNTVEMRDVQVAQIDGDTALIDAGLKAGERVVVDGQYKLQPGTKVEVITRDKPQTRLGELAPAKPPQGKTRTAAVE
jgi:membrane fusion protein, multidrug efflux system